MIRRLARISIASLLLSISTTAHCATWECGGWAAAPTATEACQRYYDFEHAQGRLSYPVVVTGIGSAGCHEIWTIAEDEL